MFHLFTTNYEFDRVMHIHEHSCTPYMRDEAFTLSRLHAAHARCFQHVWNSDECLPYDTCMPYTCVAYMYAVHVW